MNDSSIMKRENTDLEIDSQEKVGYEYFLIPNVQKNSFKEFLVKWKMKYTLCKLREILIQERNKSYYRNAINLKEIIELENGSYFNNYGVEYITKQNMQIYQNGMIDFFTMKKIKIKR